MLQLSQILKIEEKEIKNDRKSNTKMSDREIAQQIDENLGSDGMPQWLNEDHYADDAYADKLMLEEKYRMPAYGETSPVTLNTGEMPVITDAVLHDEDEPLLGAGDPELLLEAGELEDLPYDDKTRALHDGIYRTESEAFQDNEPTDEEINSLEFFKQNPPHTRAERAPATKASEYHVEEQSEVQTPTAETGEKIAIDERFNKLLQTALDVIERRKEAVANGDRSSSLDDFESFYRLYEQYKSEGLSEDSLELVAKLLTGSFDIIDSQVAKPTEERIEAVVSTEVPAEQQPSEEAVVSDEDLEGIDDEVAHDEVVSSKEVSEQQKDKEVSITPESTLEKVKGFWARNREAIKMPEGVKYWAERWKDRVTNPYYELGASLTTFIAQRQDKYEQKLADMSSEEREDRRKANRVLSVLGTASVAAAVIVPAVLRINGYDTHFGASSIANGLLDNDNGLNPLQNMPSTGSHEALSSAAGSPTMLEHQNTPDLENGARWNTPDTVPTPVPEAVSPDAFNIEHNEGGLQLFGRLNLKETDWDSAKQDLLVKFPKEFYLSGDDIRINHVGMLPQEVQQYITDRFKG